jgi:hypothetical protein
MGSLKENLRC